MTTIINTIGLRKMDSMLYASRAWTGTFSPRQAQCAARRALRRLTWKYVGVAIGLNSSGYDAGLLAAPVSQHAGSEGAAAVQCHASRTRVWCHHNTNRAVPSGNFDNCLPTCA